MPTIVKSTQGTVFGSIGIYGISEPSVPTEPPVWETVPDGSTLAGTTHVINMHQWVTGSGLGNWSLSNNPDGVTIDQVGVVHVPDTVAAQVMIMSCTVENVVDTATSNTFLWELTEAHIPAPPAWEVVPPQETDVTDLPASLDMTDYVTSFLSITSWDTNEGVINAAGLLTIPEGTDIQTLVIIVTATNDDGSNDSAPFNWDITQEAPVWDTVPNLDAQVGEEYQIPMTNWVTGDDLTGWILTDNPTGVTIDTAGLVTIEDSVPESSLTMTCTVENQGGAATSNTFTWELTAVPLQPPIWIEDPVDQTTDEEDLPGAYDVSGLVFSLLPVTWEVTAPGTVTNEGTINIDTAPGDYPLVVTAINDDGQTDSPSFNWEIVETPPDPEPPEWDDDIPDFSVAEDALPKEYNLAEHVTSVLPLYGWALSGNPTEVTIDTTGLVTAAVGTAIGEYSMSCYVENDDGNATSSLFALSVTEATGDIFYDDFNTPDKPLAGYNNWELLTAFAPGATIENSAVIATLDSAGDGSLDIQPLDVPESYAIEATVGEMPGGILNAMGIGGYARIQALQISFIDLVWTSAQLGWVVWIDGERADEAELNPHDINPGSVVRLELTPNQARFYVDGDLISTWTGDMPEPIGDPVINGIRNINVQNSGSIEDFRVMPLDDDPGIDNGELFDLTIADVTFSEYGFLVDNYGLNDDSNSETGVIVPKEFEPNDMHVINALIFSDEGSGKRVNVRFTPSSLGPLFQTLTIGFPDSGLDNLSIAFGDEIGGYYGSRNVLEHYEYFEANEGNTIPIILYYQGEPLV